MSEQTANLTAKLFPLWTIELGSKGMTYTDKYKVIFGGDAIVERFRNPETDLARPRRARGCTGSVTMLDRITGKPRTFINIEKAAKLMSVETGISHRFVKYRAHG